MCSVSSYDAHRFMEELGKNFNKDNTGFIVENEEVDQLWCQGLSQDQATDKYMVDLENPD